MSILLKWFSKISRSKCFFLHGNELPCYFHGIPTGCPDSCPGGTSDNSTEVLFRAELKMQKTASLYFCTPEQPLLFRNFDFPEKCGERLARPTLMNNFIYIR